MYETRGREVPYLNVFWLTCAVNAALTCAGGMTLSNLTQLRYNLEVGPDMRKGFDQISFQILI